MAGSRKGPTFRCAIQPSHAAPCVRALLAQTGCWRLGRACPLCPGISDINLFRYCQGIVHFDAQISDRAFDLSVAKQKLDGPEIASAPVDQGCLRAPERMRSE